MQEILSEDESNINEMIYAGQISKKLEGTQRNSLETNQKLVQGIQTYQLFPSNAGRFV